MYGYRRADFAPLRKSGYGVGFHWTTWTLPREGPAKPFDEAVDLFDVKAFVAQAVETGAGHVLFPLTHAMHWMPCPNPEVDRLIAGRTCERDLVMEIADGLAEAGIRLMLYYHHGCDLAGQDPAWQEAVGGQALDQTRFHECFCRVVGWLGERYGPKLMGFWFDAAYGPMRRAAPPFERWTAAAKAGNGERLVAYNAGIERHTLYTGLQDYWAGEMIRLNFVPRGPLTPAGLPWHAYVSWHAYEGAPLGGEWGIGEESIGKEWPPPAVESVVDFLRRFERVGGAATFNLLCYQDGAALESDLAVMKQVRERVR